jgi:hypothetical protein
MNLPARDLVSLERALLRVEGAHVADEGLGDLGGQFDRFAARGLKIGVAARYCESNQVTSRVGLERLGPKCSSDALPRSCCLMPPL